MRTEELESIMEEYDLLDNVLLHHGYRTYMRDYELVVEVHVGPQDQGVYSYLFTFCTESHVVTARTDENYRTLLDESLILPEAVEERQGFVWGRLSSQLYPGWLLKRGSEKAARWHRRIGLHFHEVEIKTNAYVIGLIFSGIVVSKISNVVDENTARLYLPRR